LGPLPRGRGSVTEATRGSGEQGGAGTLGCIDGLQCGSARVELAEAVLTGVGGGFVGGLGEKWRGGSALGCIDSWGGRKMVSVVPVLARNYVFNTAIFASVSEQFHADSGPC
jgi:hypothetical protein